MNCVTITDSVAEGGHEHSAYLSSIMSLNSGSLTYTTPLSVFRPPGYYQEGRGSSRMSPPEAEGSTLAFDLYRGMELVFITEMVPAVS